MSRRVQRVGEQLKREISHVLRSQVHDPRVSGVTVTGVEVSPDLTFARVWVQLSGDEEKRRTALEGLNAAAPFVRRQLGDLIRVRRIPELDFQQDLTLERALRIEALLREVTPAEGLEGGHPPAEGGAAETEQDSDSDREDDEDQDEPEE
jgi:ribosome-binding factor A